MRVIKLLGACGIIVSTVAGAHAQAIDWTKIDGIFGRTAAVSGAVHRYGFPVARQEDAACLSSKNGFHGTVRAAANGNRAAASVSGPH